MNPKNVKKPLDRAKVRENYLSTLLLEASNNQRNQNANVIFKKTGQTPAPLPDTRTATERLADVEGLKVELRSKLLSITDGVIASQIVNEINADQIRFALDKWGIIEPEMKKTYATGVPASVFIAYLNRLIEKIQFNEDMDMGLQQTSALVLSANQILLGLPRPELWNRLKTQLQLVNRQFGIDVRPVQLLIRQNETFIPTPDEMRMINGLPEPDKNEVRKIMDKINESLPSAGDIIASINELGIGLANRSPTYTQGTINGIIEILTIQSGAVEGVDEVRKIIDANYGLGAPPAPPAALPDAPPAGPVSPDIPELGSFVVPSPPEEVGAIPRNIDEARWRQLGYGDKELKINFLNERLKLNPTLVLTTDSGKKSFSQSLIKGRKKGYISYGQVDSTDLNQLYRDYLRKTDGGNEGNGLNSPFKMNGRGLSVKEEKPLTRSRVNKPYRQSIKHLIDKPVEKPRPYTQFGRYFINKQRLEGEGIIAFRQPSGNTIGTLPTEKVSRNIAKVMSVLVGNGLPSYEDIANLSQEEKKKLHYICKTCRIDNPAIPKMKGEGEQEDDKFNILKGEIIAGNDSPQIARQFKILLLKMTNEGRIPKRQANEILQELLVLGV